jgi:hypothetical protein
MQAFGAFGDQNLRERIVGASPTMSDVVAGSWRLDRSRALALAQSRFGERRQVHPQSFIFILDVSSSEAYPIITDGLRVKAKPESVNNRFRGRAIALLFEKVSTRTQHMSLVSTWRATHLLQSPM